MTCEPVAIWIGKERGRLRWGVAEKKLEWESWTVLLLVLPVVCANVVAETHHWFGQVPAVAAWALGLSAILGFAAFNLRAATAGAALTGALINASLMYATSTYQYEPWRTAVVPVLAVFLLTFVATRVGRAKKERLGTAERRVGRRASQVAANLGMAALVTNRLLEGWAGAHGWPTRAGGALFVLGLAALAEAAADTVSSELGQVLGGRPRMITTMRQVEPGRDGAISVAGTLAGVVAAAIVAAAGALAVGGGIWMFSVAAAGGACGLIFDSLLGATLEQGGMLNNDAVNFLSTLCAATVAWLLMG
ncbi:MAG TPA: DUF92 domain-containing protein [Terracidiphilus sp.]